MKCPYCKKRLVSLKKVMIVANFNHVYISNEIAGKVLRTIMIPDNTKMLQAYYICPNCERHLTKNTEVAREILLDTTED
jgi:hypothetical protein